MNLVGEIYILLDIECIFCVRVKIYNIFFKFFIFRKILQILCGNLDDWEGWLARFGPSQSSGYHQKCNKFSSKFSKISWNVLFVY